jgi:putative NADH-flavin reductase
MKLAVLGGSGRTGRHLIDHALAAGHAVRALVRDPARAPVTHERLEWVQGDARDPAAVLQLLEGCDAVTSALGPTKGAVDVCSVATANVLAAMRARGIKRYVLVSGAGLDAPGDRKDLPGKLISKLVRLISPALVADKERELAALQASDVEWVLVRPPRLVDAPPNGAPRVSTERSLGTKIGRATLADFLLSQVTDARYVRQAPFVSA